ncbi:response regulator [uncultured Dokdonia sp.]|jgi:response regulator of citrate/malate metabolism|uniref:response regulator n=1 Tax=uncultured Dokdonia sp. TaxID=575653 RepID=UPI0030EEF424|tara:strand:+ start:190827 stop:191258 length:432 start_codon:yes stop_codon:yes gene_type:complete
MMKVLLIDDDKAVNFFNQHVVIKHNSFEHIKTVQSGHEGLAFLSQVKSGEAPKPDLIFLDINMPAMNGWEFLDEYEKMCSDFRKDIKVIILSSSSNPEHVNKTIQNYKVIDFINKPLSFDILDNVLKVYNNVLSNCTQNNPLA